MELIANLGVADCPFWPRGTPGCVNVDIIHTGNEDLVADAVRLPFRDASLDGVFAHHLLEHLRRAQAVEALRDWRRLLKRGGFLSVVVPDWYEVLKISDPAERDRIMLGIDDARGPYQRHQSMWTFEELRDAVTAAGFNHIERIDPAVYVPLVARPRWQTGVRARR